MKTDQNKRQSAGIFEKYLDGEMNLKESLAFEEKISGLVSKQPDTTKAWTKVHDRLLRENMIPKGSVSTSGRFLSPVFTLAAVILILLAVGATIYLTSIHRPAADMVSVNTGNETNTLVKTLADGSVIYIAHHSLFAFPEKFDPESRNVTLKGEAFFDIAPNPAKPFIIETDQVLIKVLGTAFNVKTQDGGRFELTVDRGKVMVSLKNDPSKSETALAGEKISSFANSLIKSKPAANEASSWYRQQMHFKDESLQNIIRVLNRNFNTTFALADAETGNHKLTVTFGNETAETMTELICVSLNLKSQNIHGAIVFSENRKSPEQK